MIPLHLSITGFLSYRDLVEIDFTKFDLACIAGPNGAGKSSLLDAITWALFGQARKRDDSLINLQSSIADVNLTFAYEGNIYRVQRINPSGKTTMLEFHILQDDQLLANKSDSIPSSFVDGLSSLSWKPLTERTLRETDARIQGILRMDYETFTNASFFLQGKADQFTQQRSGDRKRILGSILGLEVWDGYRRRASERRRAVESDISGLEGRLEEIVTELSEEQARVSRLEEFQADLERLGNERQAQEVALQSIRQIAATLAEQEKLVEALMRQLETVKQQFEVMQTRLDHRCQEKDSYAEIISRMEEIEACYGAWEQARTELAHWEEIAGQFREHEKRREAPRNEIQTARAHLEQEMGSLESREKEIEALEQEISDLETGLEGVQGLLAKAEERLSRKERLDADLQLARQRLVEAQAENPRLKAEMEELKARIDQLTAVDGAECPLCGQPLEGDEREQLIERLNTQGLELGDRYRANQALLREADEMVSGLEAQILELSQSEAEAREYRENRAQLQSRLVLLIGQRKTWQERDKPRLEEIRDALEKETYAPDAFARLAEVDAELKEIGYDAAAHDAIRREEQAGRASEADLRALEKARAALAPLEREISELENHIAQQRDRIVEQEEEHQNAAVVLAQAQAQAPDLEEVERALFDLQEQENRLRLEVGAAQQKVLVLDDLKVRKVDLETQRETLAGQVGQYRQLERAFGKDGVPALLIEQALPEIETKANEILARLSAGNMSVRFITQSKYKDKGREDLRETLDIQISDSAGARDYEMYSGGEAFRVNFAIRLALSEVLAQRAGARLQTLVIDEGFGSQDAQGRQRLIEAINLVREDFAKVLIITHIEELKDAFPHRIEVEKTDRGSIVQVI